MRELKFRAWDKGENSYIATGFNIIGEIMIFGVLFQRPLEKLNDLVIDQYIGLNDKNGKEIYEGDILRTPNNDWGVVVKKNHFYEVTISETESSLYTEQWMKSCEVIGNIHENPELLQVKK